MKLPPDGPVCGGCGSGQSGESRRPSRSRRDGGYCSALRPIVSLPRGSRRSRAREPGSSPERHLLPLLWKRPPHPASQGGSPGTPPLRRQPRPPHGPPPTVAAAAAAAAILARPGAPSQRHVRAAPAFPPPARARVQGSRLRARFPRILCKKRRLCPLEAQGGRAWGELETLESLHKSDRLKLVSNGQAKGWLGPRMRSTE